MGWRGCAKRQEFVPIIHPSQIHPACSEPHCWDNKCIKKQAASTARSRQRCAAFATSLNSRSAPRAA
eukprot:503906-Pyramimonas_sp.AAC.1